MAHRREIQQPTLLQKNSVEKAAVRDRIIIPSKHADDDYKDEETGGEYDRKRHTENHLRVFEI